MPRDVRLRGGLRHRPRARPRAHARRCPRGAALEPQPAGRLRLHAHAAARGRDAPFRAHRGMEHRRRCRSDDLRVRRHLDRVPHSPRWSDPVPARSGAGAVEQRRAGNRGARRGGGAHARARRCDHPPRAARDRRGLRDLLSGSRIRRRPVGRRDGCRRAGGAAASRGRRAFRR
ncbi:MAG: hypothetical protein ACK55I_15045, partial [bacterium]